MLGLITLRRLPLGTASTILSAVVLASLSGAAEAQTICGDLTINVTEDIQGGDYGVYSDSCGSVTVTVSEGTSITISNLWSSPLIAWGRANTTVNIHGNVLANSPNAIGLDLYGSTVDALISGSGTVVGTYYGSGGNETLSIASGGKWTTAGMNTFWLGEDSITNAGTIYALGGAIFESVENFSNSGLLALGEGTIEFQGDVEFANSGSIRAWNGNTLLSIGNTVVNTGHIDLADGMVNDTLQITGSYAGLGEAAVHLDASSTSSDQLVIGGAASGITALFVNTSVLIPEPMLVVDTGTSEPGAFVLGSTSATPLIDISLSQMGDDFYVTAVPSESALSMMRVGRLARSLWYQTSHTVLAQIRSGPLKRSRRASFNFWAHGHADQVNALGMAGGNTTGLNASATQYRGIQAGVDYYLSGKSVIGVSVGYMPGAVNSVANAQGVETTNSSFGIHGQFAVESGFHAGVIAKFERNAMRLTNPAFAGIDGSPDTTTAGVEVETGFQTKFLGGTVGVDAGLGYVRDDVRDFVADGLNFNLQSATSIRGRVGVRFESSSRGGIYADAKLFHEFAGDEQLRVTQGSNVASISTEGATTSARFELGFGVRGQGAALSSWMELGSVKALGLNAELRFN